MLYEITDNDFKLFTIRENNDNMAQSNQNTLQITGDITRAGMIIYIDVFNNGEDFTKWNVEKVNARFQTVSFMIDTGADISTIDARHIETLGLEEVEGSFKGQGFGGLVEIKKYKCLLYHDIFRGKAFPFIVGNRDFQYENFKGILGRDFLQYFTLLYDGWSNTFRLINVNV